MAFFSKPPAKKKPEPSKAEVRPRAASARELAAQAGTKGARRHIEPAGGDMTVTGASLAQWAPAQASFEVAQANPGLCAVLENAALRFANGQAADARRQLEEGIENDIDTKLSVLAWLALFDLLAAPARPCGIRQARPAVCHAVRALGAGVGRRRRAGSASPRVVGGSIVVTGKVTAAAATQIEAIRRAVAAADARRAHRSHVGHTTSTTPAPASSPTRWRRRAGRGSGCNCSMGRSSIPRSRMRSRTAARRARARGYLSLELLQWTNDRSAFEDRAIEFAMAFELSPPSWEPSLSVAVPAEARRSRRSRSERRLTRRNRSSGPA